MLVLIGRMNRPRLWRSPMQIEMMSPLSTMRTSMARRFWMAVMEVNRSVYLSSGLAYTPVKPLSTPTCVERILAAADKLFYAKGIRAVGVDAVAAQAGVSKRTLYNHYPSKDALIAAYLQARFKHIAPSDAPAREQILGAFDRLERMFADGSFRGCPYVNAVTEIGDPRHVAASIAVQFKEQRRLWFRALLERLGVKDADALATQQKRAEPEPALLLELDGD